MRIRPEMRRPERSDGGRAGQGRSGCRRMDGSDGEEGRCRSREQGRRQRGLKGAAAGERRRRRVGESGWIPAAAAAAPLPEAGLARGKDADLGPSVSNRFLLWDFQFDPNRSRGALYRGRPARVRAISLLYWARFSPDVSVRIQTAELAARQYEIQFGGPI